MSSTLDLTRTMKTSVSPLELRIFYLFPATTLEHAPLEAVYIYFDTATYDEIERDEKVVLESTIMIIVLCIVYCVLVIIQR